MIGIYLNNPTTAVILKDAYSYSLRSPDPSSQLGAVVVTSDNWFVNGLNDFTAGIVAEDVLCDRECKLAHIEHAERAAIYEAAYHGLEVVGATMYCPWACCSDCARGIVLSGISRLMVHKERMDLSPERWRKSMDIAMNILTKAEIVVNYYSGPIDSPPVLVNGRLWSPLKLDWVDAI